VTLEDLARTPRLLVALDFDGTLAPLVDEPMTARMAPEAAAAVSALVAAPATTVALVSGRTLDDLRVIAEHDASSPVVLAASHGAQWWHPGDDAADRGESGTAVDDAGDADGSALRDELRATAEQLVADLPGVWIEPKTFGFAVHSRMAASADAEHAHGVVDALVAQRAPQWRRRTGHALTEYAFRAEGKDSAIARLRTLTGATGVLFAGDDVTDEDALGALLPGDLGIRVGDGPTVATMRVADTTELAALLTTLAHRRSSARE
jgi:trehalose 6-phosphate phosphatase